MIDVSYKIKNERLKKKMTQEDLAEQILVSRQTVSNWENGRSIPNYENLVLLSKIFNIPVDHFYVENNLNNDFSFVYKGGIKKQKFQEDGLWNTGLLVMLIISIFIPYAAPISLCVLFTWKDKVNPRLFKGVFIFIISITTVEILAMIFISTHFIF
ncbi:helix-turn-helix transcriptional regulator [Candidatus Enterococcus courvalinii]|uniref:Helix-turn-helix transcriptional regulator n=1 Tax=Candidatus Enterococcus courvalinii TaxID=2815329 RepID=A0ABS3I436_9ENTE|nr:helix-turn-helix transcriptional regulator [Enterococcus sp. MSG2901]MBO0483090.1 helix-turn-helix transcriptional regulator [Enterococcus sp. MSG2901]